MVAGECINDLQCLLQCVYFGDLIFLAKYQLAAWVHVEPFMAEYKMMMETSSRILCTQTYQI